MTSTLRTASVSGNSRNGTSPKTIKGKRGQVQIEVPRERAASFSPQLIKKGQTRFDGFDERVLSLYARGLSVGEIQAHLEEIYGVDVSPDLISSVTDAVLDDVPEVDIREFTPGLIQGEIKACLAQVALL